MKEKKGKIEPVASRFAPMNWLRDEEVEDESIWVNAAAAAHPSTVLTCLTTTTSMAPDRFALFVESYNSFAPLITLPITSIVD